MLKIFQKYQNLTKNSTKIPPLPLEQNRGALHRRPVNLLQADPPVEERVRVRRGRRRAVGGAEVRNRRGVVVESLEGRCVRPVQALVERFNL